MDPSVNNRTCAPLMEACTLALYQKNIFRVTGLPVDATSKEVSRQAQKLQMLEEVGGLAAGPQPAFSPAVPPTAEEIRAALSRMKEPEHRMVDEFFWYWPEEFGSSKNDPAIQAMLGGDTEGAVGLWRKREKAGSPVALHNMAIMYHMFAVDWTNYHVSYEIDQALDDQIKSYWRKSFDRWEKITARDDVWEKLKARIHALDDEALTTGFVRRMLHNLPNALDKVNGEAALRLAEQGRLDWAKFHVEFMKATHQGLDNVTSTAELVLRPTKLRVDQYLESFVQQAEKNPPKGAELAVKLLDRCRPLMDLFNLFHGKEAHQRNDLFDHVAETVLQMVVHHQKSTDDNATFVSFLKTTLSFAAGPHVRERIIRNISIGEENLRLKQLVPLFEALQAAENDLNSPAVSPARKLSRIKLNVLTKIPEIATNVGTNTTAYRDLMDKIAIVLRGISIDAHNSAKDFPTAEAAIQLALKLAISEELILRIKADEKSLSQSKSNSICYFCGKETSEDISVLNLAMHGDVVRHYRNVEYRKLTIPIPRCKTCEKKMSSTESMGCVVWFVCLIIGAAVGSAMGRDSWIGGGIAGFIVGLIVKSIISDGVTTGLSDPKKYPGVKEMMSKGWKIGDSPSR